MSYRNACRLIFVTILSLSVFQVNGVQTTDLSAERQSFSRYILANSEIGYITFFGGLGNIEPLWFEGKLIPNYLLRIHQNARWGAVITPKIVIRMYQQYSQPVRTPSYMPQIAFYHQIGEPTSDFHNIFYLFAKIVHHSNGQDGDFFNSDGSLNTYNGDFSTNYIEIGGIISKMLTNQLNATEYFMSSIEYHPPFLQYEPLHDIYGNLRWHNEIQVFKFTRKTYNSIFNGKDDRSDLQISGKRPVLRAQVRTTYIFGKLINADSFDFLKRAGVTVTFSYHPDFLQDVRFFAQYYYGQDYYNMYFAHTLNILRFGMMVDTFNI